jgi:hypothetical protein
VAVIAQDRALSDFLKFCQRVKNACTQIIAGSSDGCIGYARCNESIATTDHIKKVGTGCGGTNIKGYKGIS